MLRKQLILASKRHARFFLNDGRVPVTYFFDSTPFFSHVILTAARSVFRLFLRH